MFGMWLLFIWIAVSCTLAWSVRSPAMPACDLKATCDAIWEPSNLNDCIEGTCRCTGGSVYIESKKTCICLEGYVTGSTMCLAAAKTEGDSCKEDIQCKTHLGELAICETNRCYCRTNSTLVNGVCHRKKGLSESCENNEECSHIENALCQENVCVCADNFVPSSNSHTCIAVLKNMWDSCEEDIQCASFGDGAHCKSRCICRNTYHQVNNHCIKNKGLDDECSVPADCYLEGAEEGHLDCVNRKCACSVGYTISNDKFSCVKSASMQMSLSLICLLAATAVKML